MVKIKELVRMPSAEYIKVTAEVGVRENIILCAYYIRYENWEKMVSAVENKSGDGLTDLMLLQYSDIAVDVNFNMLIKCRWDLQELIEVSILQA